MVHAWKRLLALGGRRRWMIPTFLGVALVVAAVVVLLVVESPSSTAQSTTVEPIAPQPPAQPVRFSHKVHVEQVGIACLYCHSNAPRGQVASIPSVEKCIACHAVIEGQTPQARAEIAKIRDAWERGVPLQWEKKTDLPDFVYFSHQPHIKAGVSCVECHGQVGSTDMPPRNFNMTMGFCLDCHRQQAPEKVAKLVDCATCHK